MAELKLFMLGTPRIEFEGKPIDFHLRKATALLVYFAVKKRKISRDELVAIFWPESDRSSALANLRRTLYIINKAVGDEALLVGMDTIGFTSMVSIWTDVEIFRQRLLEFKREDSSQEEIAPQGLQILEEVVAIYKDDFLAGFSLPDTPEFDEWLFFESESLRKSLSSALIDLSRCYQKARNYDRAIFHARHWLSLDTLHEPAHCLLMELYTQAGQQAAALRQYKECVRILDSELGVSPQLGTRKLYESILLHRELVEKQPVEKRPEVKYVASGDVHIAYTVFGEGPVDIIGVMGFITHMEHIWEEPGLTRFFEELASFSRVILFDRRGVGLSDRVGYAPTLNDTMDDILAIMRAIDSKHAILFGYIEGGPNSMLFTATYPERVSGLILYGTCAKYVRSPDYPWALRREQYDRWLENITKNWGDALDIEVYAPSQANDVQLKDWWAKFMRSASSPGGMKAVFEVMRDIDVSDILPAIRTPTLILHRKEDRVIRVGAARYLASQIPGARYIELDGQDSWFWVGDWQSILREIKKFIKNLESPSVPERMLATIVLVELLDAGLSADLDQTTSILLDTVYAFLKRETYQYRGSEVKWRRSRYLVTFDRPSRAIHFAKAIIESGHQRGLNLRVGMHTGECEFKAGELMGTAVIICESVLNSAEPSQIMVSSTVKDLVVGAGFKFTQYGECSIKEVGGKWKVYRVE
jgi:DNA-binding SARP family transcriptional activator/pimeloyl-ACP methyl ester carboxylesterase